MSNESLIKADEAQLKLFSSDQMDAAFFAEEESGPNRVFTGARLFAQNPELYKAIVALSAEGLGAIRIGRILHVSAHTVQAVREREPEAVAIEKNRIANLSRAGARMCVEGILDMLSDPEQAKKISLKDKGIVFGILVEKDELLSGSPTSRVLNVTATIDYDEYVRVRREEYERQRMGLSRGKEETNAEPAGADQRQYPPISDNIRKDPSGPGPDEAELEHLASVGSGAGQVVMARQGRPAAVGAGMEQGWPAIAAPGAPGERRRPLALLEAPKGTVGQTPHQTSKGLETLSGKSDGIQ